MRTAVHPPSLDVSRPELWRVTDRASFQALRRGRRVRRGPLSVAYVPADPVAVPSPARVAFAVGTATGGAVVRNRVRRRLRAALRELVVEGRLPAGTYLVGASAEVARTPWSELVSLLADAVDEVTR